jgi:hypothetical protein
MNYQHNKSPLPFAGVVYFKGVFMFHPVFEGIEFSCYYETETEQYLLHWSKYEIDILLKDEDSQIFRQQLELIHSEPEKDIQARIERTIKIHFYFRYANPMPQFSQL